MSDKEILGYQIGVMYYRGGRTLLIADKTGLKKLKQWADCGHISDIKTTSDGRYTAQVVDDKFLTFAFKPKR